MTRRGRTPACRRRHRSSTCQSWPRMPRRWSNASSDDFDHLLARRDSEPPVAHRQQTRCRRHLRTGSRGEVVMAGPLLETKLHVPRRRRGLVARPRLSERLSRGAESALTLVSAPAGFGKTTLLAEWLAAAPADGRSVAWLSLDQRDNDPAVFWTYLVAALQTAAPGSRCGRALAPAVAPAADRSGPGHPAQRPRRRLGRGRAGARRLPRHRGARRAGRDGLPARPPAAAAPPGDRQPRRPAVAAGPAARAWRARRDPRRRSALHAPTRPRRTSTR